MAEAPLLYYITDRAAFPGDERTRRLRLLDKIAEAVSHGVDFVQLREKDLPAREIASLAREAMNIINQLITENPERRKEQRTAFLINSRTDVAMAVAANGVHLPADDISPKEVRAAWKCGGGVPFDMLKAGSARELSPHDPLIGVSCHSPQEVLQAAANHATFAVFAPVFEKRVFEKKVFEKKDSPATSPDGLDALREACRAEIPVLALGGVTLQNASSCLRAGAAGIAAIRLFQDNDISTIVRELRG
jgi:thiamine-phosphate pyrophosphorylase